MEYTTDVLDFRSTNEGIVVLATKWLNLGNGRTPLDPNWWNHLQRYPERLRKYVGTDEIQPLDSSIRVCFQRDDRGTSHDHFTHENATKLLELRKFNLLDFGKQLKHNESIWREYGFGTWDIGAAEVASLPTGL